MSNAKSKHVCEFTRSKPSATVDTCYCGKFRHNENNKSPIITEQRAVSHTPTPQFKTLDEAKGWLGHDAVLRAVNAHEELLKAVRKAIKRLRDGDGSDSFFPEQDHEAIEIMEQAIAKGEDSQTRRGK